MAVIGPAASAAPTDTGGGSAYVHPPVIVTPLAGVKAAAGSGTSVVYQPGLPTDTALPSILAPTCPRLMRRPRSAAATPAP